MDDLLDLVFFLVALIGKYWFVILGYFVYKILGMEKKGKKKAKQRTMPPFTPVHPDPMTGRMTVEKRSKTYPPIIGETTAMEASPAPERPIEEDEDWHPIPRAEMTRVEEEETKPARPAAIAPVMPDTAAMSARGRSDGKKHVSHQSVREGMKWAIILSPPRSKAPYTASALRKRGL